MSQQLPKSDLKVGQRIRLVKMGDDPRPIPPGETGTVTRVNPLWDGEIQVSVDWDSGRGLMLILPHDRIMILSDGVQNDKTS